VILVGGDPASEIYVRLKTRAAARLGFRERQVSLPAHTPENVLLKEIDALNADSLVDGILVQLPLPPHIQTPVVLDRVDPAKDVDGFHPDNVGLLVHGRPQFTPCTPLGIMRILEHWGVPLKGRTATVIGSSLIVGRPTALLLEQALATVTVCHIYTPDLEACVRRADIVVSAMGQPEEVRGSWIKKGACVVDVGINRMPCGRIVGDVDYEGARCRAGYITPVPGGVGPMTIAMLMSNTFEASFRNQK